MKKILTILFIVLTSVSFSKNIYVVYDDSLSMKKDNRSVYANYAMQTLIALQEPEDNFIITRMSDHKNDFRNKLFIDLKDTQKEIKYFKDNIEPKSMITPYNAVESMLDYIESAGNDNEPGWLIIISDGYFEDGKPILRIEDIKRKVQKIVREKNIKPIFLLIGSNESELAGYEKQEGIQIWKDAYGKGEYPKVYKSVGKDDIVDKMEKIAQLLTNKSESREKIYKIDGNKVIFSPKFPLKKVILLEQGDIEKNGMKTVTINGKKVRNIDSYLVVKETKKMKLKGNVIHIDNKYNNLSQQEQMVIEFMGNGPKNVKLYPEVAGEFIVKLYDEDMNEIKDKFNEIEEGRKLKVIAKLVNNLDGVSIEHCDGILTKINYGEKEIPLKYDRDKKEYIAEVEITKDKKSVDVVAEYDGYFYYQSDLYIIEGVDRKPIVVEIPEPVVILPPPAPKIYSLELEKNINNEVLSQHDIENLIITIIPKIDGNPLTEDEFKELKLKVKTKFKGELEEQGNYWTYTSKIIQGKIDSSRPQGDYSFIVNLKGDKLDIKKQLDLKIAKLSFGENYGTIIKWIIEIVLAIIVLLGWVFKKKKFKPGDVIIKRELDQNGNPLDLDYPYELKCSVFQKLPYVSHSATIDGIKFYAEEGNISVNMKDISSKFNVPRVKRVYINGDLIDKETFLSLTNNNRYSIYRGNEIKIEYDDKCVREYIYTNK